MSSPKQTGKSESGCTTSLSTPTSHVAEQKESKSEPRKQLMLSAKHGFHKSVSTSSLTAGGSTRWYVFMRILMQIFVPLISQMSSVSSNAQAYSLIIPGNLTFR